MTTLPEPTRAQQHVIEGPSDAKALVTAGAGTGKTFTLVRRIEHVLRDGLRPRQLLVLTFSRAASAELRERLRATGTAAAYIRVSTFDAWALQILRETVDEQAWVGKSFDERIVGATARLADADTAPESLEDVLHLVVDEVQDLVGVRRELVQTFLDAYECGFTVVGDLAQAIYGFQVTDPAARAAETGMFIAWLRRRFEDELVEFSLDRNFRAQTDDAAHALQYTAQVRVASTAAEGLGILEALRLELAGLLEFGDLSVPYVGQLLGSRHLSTAILCSTNGQALLISEWLADLNLPHVVRRSAGDRTVPAWVAGMVRRLGAAQTVSKWDFLAAWKDMGHLGGEEEWNELLRVSGDRGGTSIVLDRLRTAVVRGTGPDLSAAHDGASVMVSTFHRAKGLEFDRVLIVDPGPPGERPGQADEALCDDARALYVAMTRARQELYRLVPPSAYQTRPNKFSLLRSVKHTDRWGRYGYKVYQRLGLSASPGDVHRSHPAGLQQIGCDPVATQQYLADDVAPGDELRWERLSEVPDEHDRHLGPGYVLLHGDRPVGVASEDFRRDLYTFMQQRRNSRPARWPRTISELRVDIVETVAGENAAASLAGLGPHGLWLAPRPMGIGRFSYDATETQEKDA